MVQAKGLASKHKSGVASAYVKLSLGKMSAKTSVRKKTNDPVFGDCFYFDW